jgi:hypothetical protein
MSELGYQEGRNFSFDFLQTASADEHEVLYGKLAARVPDVILTIGPEIALRSASWQLRPFLRPYSTSVGHGNSGCTKCPRVYWFTVVHTRLVFRPA